MIRTHAVSGILAFLMAAGSSAAASLYGSYQISVSHNCDDPACTSATDIITGVGSNTLQGFSDLFAMLTEDAAGNLQSGIFNIVTHAGRVGISGILDLSFDPSIAPPAFALSGTAQFTGGSGPYFGFTADEIALGTGFFSGPTSAVGTLVFVPEPQSWSLLPLAMLSLFALRHLRRS